MFIHKRCYLIHIQIDLRYLIRGNIVDILHAPEKIQNLVCVFFLHNTLIPVLLHIFFVPVIITHLRLSGKTDLFLCMFLICRQLPLPVPYLQGHRRKDGSSTHRHPVRYPAEVQNLLSQRPDSPSRFPDHNNVLRQ